MYFIYGNENYFIDQKIKKIIKEHSQFEIVNLNNDCKFEEIMDNLKNQNIFSIPKIFIFKNHWLLNSEESQKIKILISEMNNSNNSFIFIFSLFLEEKQKLNLKKPLINFLNKNAQIEKVSKLAEEETSKYIKKIVEKKGGTISYVNSLKMANKLPNDLYLIINEIDKMLQLDKNINENNIEKFMTSYYHDDPFAFSNAFSNNDINEILALYKEKISLGDDINFLISQISSLFILALDIYHYQLNNFSNEKIANELNIHPFRIKKTSEFLMKMGAKKIKKSLILLAELDSDMKSGKVDEKIGFENFLLQFVR